MSDLIGLALGPPGRSDRCGRRVLGLALGLRLLTAVAQLAAEPRWEPVTKGSLRGAPLRELQFESSMLPFGEQAQCEFLGFPLDFFG